MNNISDEYRTAISNYLEQKYSEKFVLQRIVRQSVIGTEDIVTARAFSERYPNEIFEVRYHLAMSDVYHGEELTALLKETDCFDESMLKDPSEDTEPYFEDNYSNVIYQHSFDKAYCDFDATYVKTLFETTNYYPELCGVGLEEYISSKDFPLYACTMIFADESRIADKKAYMKEIKEKLSVSTIKFQFIYFHFTGMERSFLEKEFAEHYDDAVMYFKNADFLTGYENIFLKNGVEK